MQRDKPRKLTQGEFFKLCQWLENKQEMLIANAPRHTQLATMAGKDLGLEIAPFTVSSAIKVSGVTYNPAIQTGGGASKKMRVELQELQSQLKRTQADGAWLLGVVRELAAALGHPIKGDVQNPKNIKIAN